MRIQSKSTGLVHGVTKKEYEAMGYRKQKYTIIDSSDALIPTIKAIEFKKETPKQVFDADYQEEEIKVLCDQNTRDELIRLLNENEVEFDKRGNKEFLAKTYLEWTKKSY